MISVIVATVFILCCGIWMYFYKFSIGEIITVVVAGLLLMYFVVLIVGTLVNTEVIDYSDFEIYYSENNAYYIRDGELRVIDNSIRFIDVDNSIDETVVRVEEYNQFYWLRSPTVKLVLSNKV